MPEHSISITREIAADPAEVFAAWTVPERMKRWLGKVSADVQVGGHYRYVSPAADGKTQIYSGEYLVIEPAQRLVQSFLAGEPDLEAANPYSSEFIELRLAGVESGRTSLTFINGWDGAAISEQFRVQARAAWSEWLDRMERSLLEAD